MARKKETRERKIKYSEFIKTKHKELKQASPSPFVLIGSMIVIVLILFLFKTEKTEIRERVEDCIKQETNPKYNAWMQPRGSYLDSCVEQDKQKNPEKYVEEQHGGAAPLPNLNEIYQRKLCEQEYDSKHPAEPETIGVNSKCNNSYPVKCIAFFNTCVLDIDGVK